ncbi:Uncharacterised protein [Mycobacterium tuberculosis]|uniref:Uncharacterized protein n=1 Tax=Mycobacterium tuberculosis TaxID=1773 RepID=A0A655J867_MYCTX|nr:Uncharacterised protein [Mycobacterium tuberculosis]COV93575.1 Uncharacterised protein [Mycobacterium tuberculosis]COW49706.1 Uncharacterised protein [Mycobacterium tuberculosis]
MKVTGKVSSSIFSTGSISGRATVGSVMGLPYDRQAYPCSTTRSATSPRLVASVAAGTTPA